ncbi:hypothetical protein MCB86_09060 [Pseudomonas sp. KSR10]|uniref:hypothetical protein n=1 Tax=Pseudomonas sp. KSR10 TaxID=2916654 RepID=UPI001EF89C89|nr:hypothetical protein [Pseudomonas sp. KSR10]MCG6540223.1 hypothetical protein [Pseudomonas sp. KSR10]
MFTESATVKRINRQCVIWLHKPTNTRYVKVVSNGAETLMQGVSGHRYVTEDELNNAEIWTTA